ncbi:MAG: anti-sigma factor family protein [Chitinophagaceae bacterium]
MKKINQNNYLDYLLDYVDGELDPPLVKELMIFLDQHPEYRMELHQLESTRFQAEPQMVFPDHSSLYRSLGQPLPSRSTIRSLFRPGWFPYAAAAGGLLLVMVHFFLPFRKTAIPTGSSVGLFHPSAQISGKIPIPSSGKFPVPIRHSPTKKRNSWVALETFTPSHPGHRNSPASFSQQKDNRRGVKHPAVPSLLVRVIPPGKRMATLARSGQDTLEQVAQIQQNVKGTTDLPPTAVQLGEDMEKNPFLPTPADSSENSQMQELSPRKSKTNSILAQARNPGWEKVMQGDIGKFRATTSERISQKINQVQGFFARHFKFLKSRKIRVGHFELVMN